jgi:superfamily I DNA/RNA helicase
MQNAMVRVMDPAAALDDNDLRGDEGEIEILRFDNAAREASYIADVMHSWIRDEAAEPSNIVVLVSKQQNLYCQELRAALSARSVPFREEDRTQDVASEPVVRLITDFLLVVGGRAQPEAYRRLLETVVYQEGHDDEQEYRARSCWERFVADVRQRLSTNQPKFGDRHALAKLADELIGAVGRSSVVTLSADYVHGDRLNQLIEDAVDRISDMLKDGSDLSIVLTSFSADRAVRIMSIHKSKGLEVDTVVMMGVEEETFWGKNDEERSPYFVGISRAKKRLLLTVCGHRDKPEGASRWSLSERRTRSFLDMQRPMPDLVSNTNMGCCPRR